MIEVVGVTFNDRGRCYYFLPGNKKYKQNYSRTNTRFSRDRTYGLWYRSSKGLY